MQPQPKHCHLHCTRTTMKFPIYCNLFLLCLFIGLAFAKNFYGSQNARYPRSESEPLSNECRYDKGPWQDCDPNSGTQKRILTLKTSKTVTTDCPQEKFIERPCKKQCKYIKGVWSECANGSKERTDKIREDVSTSGCKAEKHISKHCKKQCTYEKSEWSSCENGIKTKTLTLVENVNTANSPDCESSKNITKVCAKGSKAKRFRKKNREQNDG